MNRGRKNRNTPPIERYARMDTEQSFYLPQAAPYCVLPQTYSRCRHEGGSFAGKSSPHLFWLGGIAIFFLVVILALCLVSIFQNKSSKQGKEGRNGVNGLNGLNGLNGEEGETGPPGEDGEDGLDGGGGGGGGGIKLAYSQINSGAFTETDL